MTNAGKGTHATGTLAGRTCALCGAYVLRAVPLEETPYGPAHPECAASAAIRDWAKLHWPELLAFARLLRAEGLIDGARAFENLEAGPAHPGGPVRIPSRLPESR